MARREILLESGTNEIEFIEFMLGDQSFGINVSKVREIITYDPKAITGIPEAHPSVLGMFILRDSTLPLIDLARHLGVDPPSKEQEHTRVVMVCEFNDLVNGFLVDDVNQIHRSSWEEISPVSSYIAQYRPSVTSSVTINDINILMVDLEHVLADIYPATQVIYHENDDPQHAPDLPARHEERAHVKLIIAEDSPIVRAAVKKVTESVGYTAVSFHDNGASAFAEVESLAARAKTEEKPLGEFINAVVSDIEMPQMDGLTVCRRIKEDLGLTNLPVIIFSSLINEQMILKCQKVGADGWANKLKIDELVHMLDKHCLDR